MHQLTRFRRRAIFELNALETRATPANLVDTLYPLDLTGPQPSARFGENVAAGQNYFVVGAPLADVGGVIDAGQAFVFDATTNALVATLDNPTPQDTDSFGAAVAVSGNLVMIGAYRDNLGTVDNTGAVYLYDMSAANKSVPIATFNNPAPTTGDQFGASIAMAGKYVAIGANNNHIGVFSAGSVYIFDLTDSNPTNPIKTIDNPAPSNNARFGDSVAMTGTRLVIGAANSDTDGIAYVYDISALPAVGLLHTLKNPVAGNGGTFGDEVALAGNVIIVSAPNSNTVGSGAGSAYVYDLNSPTPTVPIHTLQNPMPSTNANFGAGVSIFGKYVAIGAPESDVSATDGGIAYLYDLTSATPTVPLANILNPAPMSDGGFGNGISMVGQKVVIGSAPDVTELFASSYSAAYVFDATAPSAPTATLPNATTAAGDNFGEVIAASGKYIVVSAPSDSYDGVLFAGRVFVYNLLSPTPTIPVATLSNPTPANSDEFGDVVAIDGDRVVVGAPGDDGIALNAGAAYVYDLQSPTPSTPIYTFTRSTPNAQDGFGDAVAIQGSRVVIGASNGKINFGDFGSGIVFVYDLNSPTPTTPIFTFDNPAGTNNNHDFGRSVSIDGNRIVVGAPRGGTIIVGQGPTGVAYGYDLSGPTPTMPVHTFNNPLLSVDDFGYLVALSGSTATITAPKSDTNGTEAGSAYVYDLASPTPTTAVAIINHPDAIAMDNFGMALAMSGSRLAIGARSLTDPFRESQTYLFDTTWSPIATPLDAAVNPSPEAYDLFGNSVALTGPYMIVGAPGDQAVNQFMGAVHVFDFVPPRVVNVVINNGDVQRSRVTTIDVIFDQPIAVSGLPSLAFQMKRQADNATAFVDAAVNGSTVSLTFTAGATIFGSLTDGFYSLTINAASIGNIFGSLDGNGNGVGGDDYVLVGNLTNKLFRLFGDSNGDGLVSAVDFNAFRLVYGASSVAFDFDNDGQVTALDFNQFRLRYGVELGP